MTRIGKGKFSKYHFFKNLPLQGYTITRIQIGLLSSTVLVIFMKDKKISMSLKTFELSEYEVKENAHQKFKRKKHVANFLLPALLLVHRTYLAVWFTK